MNKKDIKDIFKTTFFITKLDVKGSTKQYKYTFKQLFSVAFIYSVLLIIVMSILFIFTPVRKLALLYENKELEKQAEQIKVLENKLVILTKELERISSTNQKLRYAIILAGIDTTDSSKAVLDSLRKTDDGKIPPEGNIFKVFKHLIDKYFYGESRLQKSILFIKPTKGFVINVFNPAKGHLGIDFAVKTGTPVFASAGGIVIFADYTSGDGYKIIIQHSEGYITVYKHCSVLLKTERDYVTQGETIALSGNTGFNTTGPHLHFEIWKNGKVVDPEKYLLTKKE